MQALISIIILTLCSQSLAKENIFAYLQEAYPKLQKTSVKNIDAFEYVSQGDFQISLSPMYTKGLTYCVGISVLNKSNGVALLIHADAVTDTEKFMTAYFENFVEAGDEVVAALAGGFEGEAFSAGTMLEAYELLKEFEVNDISFKYNRPNSYGDNSIFPGSASIGVDPQKERIF